jgi:hypothetical protein
MSKWFCFTEAGLDPAIKMATYTAGFLMSKNNPALAKVSLPVAQGIQKTVDGGTDNGALNAILKEGITEIVGQVSTDPLIQAAVAGVLASLKIDIPGGSIPVFSNALIKELVDSFVGGMAASVV